jgi:hypothetical protein
MIALNRSLATRSPAAIAASSWSAISVINYFAPTELLFNPISWYRIVAKMVATCSRKVRANLSADWALRVAARASRSEGLGATVAGSGKLGARATQTSTLENIQHQQEEFFIADRPIR